MTTHRPLLTVSCLVASIAAIQAQPIASLNAVRRSSESTAIENAPRKPKATVEAPFYIKLYGFYGLLTPGSQISTSYTSGQSGMTNTGYKNNTTGLGAGPRAGVGVGVIVSEFINLGIDADMLFGSTLTTENNYKGSNYTSTGTTSSTLRVLSITPNITFKALSRPAYYIYNRLGLVGGIVMDYKTTSNSLYAPTTGASTTTLSETDYRQNSLAIGYQAALGIQFRLGESLRGFAEIVAYNQSFKPKESLYTSSSTKSGSTTKSSYIYQYKSEGEYFNSKQDGLDVYQSPTYNVVMNSVGVGAGIIVRF
ncbi:hypothetical protein [Spirosoma panaciterrae]|uniref:hypothetical protein n=1 Tax=Spirosoma panaciterrae TaxID=496058 RepID=UPI00036EF804|nr:hypothetical protein [Spirosoma panaciterrae]